ncbi:MAG: LamG domain-containing protein [Candidatus Bathyarchaeota archaeon]|nr:LamG domain-containing protein [Candidatus Bathyarchaeota archaeon]
MSGTLDDTNNAFRIGASFSASQGYNGCPDGVIDEVHVYDRALTADEIASLYAVPVTLLCYNQDEIPFYDVPVYIDDEYAGVTFSTFNVKPGNHKFQVPVDIYDWLGYHEFWYYQYNAAQNYSNPMTIAVNSDKTIYAIYYSYYW